MESILSEFYSRIIFLIFIIKSGSLPSFLSSWMIISGLASMSFDLEQTVPAMIHAACDLASDAILHKSNVL